MSILIMVFVSFLAGTLGSMLGIGGGIILVPVLTQFYHVDIKTAAVASLVSIVATSASGAEKFVRSGLANFRIATFLEMGTVAGAITGFFLFGRLTPKSLYFIYAGFLFFSLLTIFKNKSTSPLSTTDKTADYFSLHGSYTLNNTLQFYKVSHSVGALVVMYFAGILSALLGIGSGILKVLAMDNLMKLPIKVSSATSNFMIGVTAAASALAYYFSGQVSMTLTPAVVIGIFFGAQLGTVLMPKLPPLVIRTLFATLLLLTGVQMFMKGWSL